MKHKTKQDVIDARALVKANAQQIVKIEESDFTVDDYALKERLLDEAKKQLPAGHATIMNPHQVLAKVFSRRSNIDAAEFEKMPFSKLKERFNDAKVHTPGAQEMAPSLGMIAGIFGGVVPAASVMPEPGDYASPLAAFMILMGSTVAGLIAGAVVGHKLTQRNRKHNRKLALETLGKTEADFKKQLPAPK